MSHVFSSFTNPSGFSHPFPKKLSESSRLEGQAVGIDLDVLEFPEPEFVMRLYLGVLVFLLLFFSVEMVKTRQKKKRMGVVSRGGRMWGNHLNQAFHFWGVSCSICEGVHLGNKRCVLQVFFVVKRSQCNSILKGIVVCYSNLKYIMYRKLFCDIWCHLTFSSIIHGN